MVLYYERSQLNSNLECPLHKGEYFPVNGVGGDGMVVVNAVLSKLPSSHLFYGAACCHDVLYNLVSAGYKVSIRHTNGRVYVLENKEDVDNYFLMEMIELASTRPWWNRWFFKHAARRNYLIVHLGGSSFFTHSHR